MADSSLNIIIKAKDEATAAVKSAFSGVKNAVSSVDSVIGKFNSSVRGTVATITGFAGAAGAVYAVKKAFEAGIDAVEDFKLSTIGIAATLTDTVQGTDEELRAAYEANVAYAEETFQRVELAAAKYFASGEEMINAWQILTQKGTVITRQEDIENLGIIVDRIKLATKGQDAQIQISQELRSLMNGQAV